LAAREVWTRKLSHGASGAAIDSGCLKEAQLVFKRVACPDHEQTAP
jgi:hypothetical protein